MPSADPKGPISVALASVVVPKSLGTEALREFKRALEEALANPHLRVLMLRGDVAGFSSGMDLSEIAETAPPEAGAEPRPFEAATAAFVEVLELLLRATPITLGVVEGPAMGGGVGLAAACDLVIATENASFALPELVLGLVPAMILPVLAGRLGLHRAKRWAITGATWEAGEATQQGLVDQKVPLDRLDAHLKRTLRNLMRMHPRGVTALKRFADELDRRALLPAIRDGQRLLSGLLEQPEVRAEIAAFRDYGILPGALES